MDNQSIKQFYLSRLAFLHSEIQGRRITADFHRNGGEITVLLDSSLVIAGLRPHLQGPAPNDRNDLDRRGLGQLLPRLPVAEISRIQSASGEVPTINAFRRSEDIQAWHVTSALIAKVYEIARGQDGKHRVFQFRSHYNETSEVFRIIEEKYHKTKRQEGTHGAGSNLQAAQRNFRRSTAALAIHHFMTEGSDIDGVADIVMKRGEQAMMAWDGGISTLAREHEALGQLKADGLPECFTIERFLEKKIASENFNSKFLEIESHARAVLRGFFHDRLAARKGHTSSSGSAHEADLEALIDLSCYNKRLMQKEINHRILFATADRNLVLSAYAITEKSIRKEVRAYGLKTVRTGTLEAEQALAMMSQLEAYFGLTQCNDLNKDGHRWFQNFAGHYMRHLWAVSEDALIENDDQFATDQTNEEIGQIARFVNPDMFHGLYAKAASRIKISRRGVEKLFKSNYFLDEQALSEFSVRRTYLHWNHLIRTRVKTWRIKNFGFDKLGEEDPTLQSMAELFPKLVYVLLEEFSSRNRDRTMVNLSDNGALDLISQLTKKRMRGRPVDLNFRTLPNTNQILLNVSEKSYYMNKLSEFSEDFNNINEDCFGDQKERDAVFDDRQRSHLKLLVLAAIFAAMEKWAAAKDHTRRAIDIIKRSKGDKLAFFDEIPTKNSLSNMSGREAWYMNSICYRMLAESDEDFARARTSLDHAVSALNDDLDHNEEVDGHFHLVRFANERWSHAIARYYYRRSMLGPNTTAKFLNCNDEFDSAIGFRSIFLLQNKEHHYSPSELLSYLVKKSKSSRKTDVTRLTTDAIALNFIQIAIICRFWEDRGEKDLPIPVDFDLVKAAQVALRWLSARTRDGDYIESFLVRLYRVGLPTVDTRFSGEKFEDKKSLGTALEAVETPELINESRVSYDIWRIDSLREFIGKSLK